MNCGEVTPRRRHSGDESRIPVPSSPILRRSGSQRLNSFSPIAEHSRNGSLPSRSPLLNRHRSLVIIFFYINKAMQLLVHLLQSFQNEHCNTNSTRCEVRTVI